MKVKPIYAPIWKQNKTKTCIKARKQWFSKHQHEAMRPVIPERWDTEMSSVIAPTYSLGKVSRSQHWKGELKQSLADSLTWDEVESPRGIRQLQFIQKVPERRELHTEKNPRVPHTGVCGNDSGQERSQTKRISKGNSARTVLWTVLVHSRTAALTIHRELVRMLRKVVLRYSCGHLRKVWPQ